MYSNHDPPGSSPPFISLPPGIEPQGTPKDNDSGSSVVDDVPPGFIEQSPVQYTQGDAHNASTGIPPAQQLVEATTANPMPNLHLAQLQTSELILNDDQLAAYHTAVHYSPTPDHPDGQPRSPTPFGGGGEERNTTPTQRGQALDPLTISIPTAYAFINATPYEPSDPGHTPVDEEQDRWETQTIEDPDTPMNPPAELPEPTSLIQTRFDDFLDYIRLPALPEDIFQYNCDTELADLDANKLASSAAEIKKTLNDVIFGYSYYYLGPEVRLRPDANVPFAQHELNMAVKIVTLALDNGMSTHTINASHQALTNTSWFRLTHGLMGAIIRASIRSPHFRKLGKHSLNGVKDHLIVARGLYRPLSHLQLMQAMAEQLQRSCETRPELSDGHYTNVYDKAVGHVANTLHTVLLNRAINNASEEELATAKERALTHLQQDFTSKIRNDPQRYNIFTTRLINQILDTFQDESREDIHEWRAAWLKGLQDCMEGRMVFVPTEGVSSQAIRNNAKAIEQEITKRFEAMKNDFMTTAHQQLVNKNADRLERDLEQKWNAHIDQQVSERREEAEHLVNARVQQWVAEEVKTRTKALQNRLQSETASEAITILHDHAAAIGYKLVPVAATIVEPSGEPFSLVPDSQMTDPIEDFSQPDAIDALARTRSAAVGGAASSIHNPANQMEDDPQSPTNDNATPKHRAQPTPPAPPQEHTEAQPAFIKMFMDGIGRLTERFDNFESRLTAIEQGKKAPKAQVPAPPPQIPLASKPTATKDPCIVLPAPTRKPAPPRQAQTQPSASTQPAETPARVTQAMSPPPPATAAQTTSPTPPPPIPPRPDPTPAEAALKAGKTTAARNTAPTQQPWIKTQPRYAAAAAKPAPTPNSRTRNRKASPATNAAPTTKITVIRKGGVANEAEEQAIRARPISETIMSLRTAIESLSASAPQLLSGHWTSSANTTGNFLLTFNGNIPFDRISPYTKIIRSVLGCGDLAPAEGWTWVQLRDVPTSDTNGHRYDNDDLNEEIRRNPSLATALFGMAPHWQQNPANILRVPFGTVLIPIVDTTDTVIKAATQQGVFMFGKQAKFVVTGDSPRLIQCGRCHMLGHPTRSPLCKLHPAAAKCYRCGGNHHSDHHDYECKGAHRTPGRCNCTPKCLLCGNTGHHARSRKCPKRGDFAPPRLDALRTDTNPIEISSASPPEVDTQRPPPLTAASLPIKVAKAKKGKGKGKNKSTAPTSTTANRYELPNAEEALRAFMNGPEAFITEWNDTPGDATQTNFTHIPPIPLTEPLSTPCHRDESLKIINEDQFASIEDVAERDSRRTHGFTISERLAVYDEEEAGWGGLPKFTCERHSLRARFAQKNDLPLTKNDIITRVTAKLPDGFQAEDGVRALNKSLGGTGDDDHLTPYHWFQTFFPLNTLITEYPLPQTVEEVIKALDDDAHDLFEVAEDFDIQMGGDGKGDALLQAIDHPTTPPHLINMLKAWAEEPDPDSNSTLVEHTFLVHSITLSNDLTTSQDSTRTATSVPGVWFWKRLIWNHTLAVDANFAESSPALADYLARTHLRTDKVIAGRPASRQLYPGALRIIADDLSKHPDYQHV